MKFVKVKKNKYKSPNGIVFTEKQMESYKKRFEK
jgi:hypothetical protein